ncbi:conserved hypothetical protein [Seinonella peptonophila]|uniref:EthD domain-containing protein n=1 Tax=Seinonella peptonophila TaxID=112248 RepID=A0A1M4VKE6_9BACL|nr:EthD family reductase [Seinonella peptonophila]SHE69302.1 conserved hypothetical protein [Seinonella peptonophila]
MYKTVGVYRNIKDVKAFEEYYVNEVMPRFLRLPGVIRMEITSLFDVTEQQPNGMENIQLLVETYYESKKAVQYVLSSSIGKDIAKKIMENPTGEVASFVGREKVFYTRAYLEEKKEDHHA